MLRTTISTSLGGVHQLRVMRVAAIALMLLVAGCQTTDPFAQWAKKETPSEKLSKQVADANAEVKSQAQAAKSASQQLQHVQTGQSEIAAWYQDGLQSHLQSAKMNFQEAARTNPQNADAHHGLGIVADLEKDFSTAEMHYQKALIYRPNDSRILGDLGYSYLLQNRLTESEQFLQRALQADPNNANASKHLSDVQSNKSNVELANMTYSQAAQHQAVEQALYQQNQKIPSQAGSDVQLANHESEESSFFDRLMKREPEKDPNQEIRDAMAAERERSIREREERERMRQMQDRSNPYANLHPTRVRQQLEAIDREAYQSAPSSPVIIDDRTGSLQRIPAQTPWSGAAPQPHQVQSGSPYSPGYQTQQVDPQTQQYAAQAQYTQTSQNVLAGYQTQPHHQSMNSGHGVPAVNALYPQGRMDQQPPNRVPHTPTQHIRNQYYESNSSLEEPAPITQAQHAVPQGNPQAHSYRQGMVRPTNSFQQQPAQQVDAYSQASRDAVRMGMGLSTTSPTTPRTSPGMGTHFNSPSFGQPQRILPTDLPPQDLNQAYQMTAQEQAPPLNSQGQQLPSSAPPTMSQEQFATASRYNLPTPQQPQQQPYYPSQQLQSYDQQRQIVDQTLNNTVQQAWGERQAGPQLTPAGGPVAVERPADFAGMGQREIVQPAPWPHQSQPNQSHPNSQQSYGYPDTDRYQTQQRQDQVVTPPPYNAQVTPRQSGQQYSDPRTQRNPSQQYGQGQGNYRNEVSANGLPMIIPADR